MRKVAFSDLVEINPRERAISHLVPFVGMGDVSTDGRLVRFHERPLSDVMPGLTPFRDDDVLVAKITPCLENGKGAFVSGLSERVGLGSTEFHVLRAKPGVSPRYVYHLTRSSRFRKEAEAFMTGSAGQRRVPLDFFERYTVENVPLAEQRRIAEILDEVDTQIQGLLAEAAKLDAIYEAVLDTKFREALRPLGETEVSNMAERVSEEVGEFRFVTIGDLLESIEAGHSPDLEDKPAGEGQWGVLKVSAVGRDGFRGQENKRVDDPGLIDPSIEVNLGDLLMTRANTPELVGLACVVDEVQPGLMLCDKTLRLNLLPQEGDPRFLSVLLRQPELRRQIEVAATGTSNSMKNISQESIRNLVVPWAAPSVQGDVLAPASAVRTKRDRLGKDVVKLKLTKQALMDDLLTGKVRVFASA